MSTNRRIIALTVALCSLWANTGISAKAQPTLGKFALDKTSVVHTAASASASPSPSVSASASGPAVPASFTFRGAGFGHGIGLSQYGAQGMATEGASAEQIVTHYFPGTALSPMPMPSNLVVGLLQDRTADQRRFIAVRSEGTGGTGNALTVNIGSTKLTIPSSTVVTFGVINNQVVVYGPTGIYQDGNQKNLSAAVATVSWGTQVQGSKKSTVANVASDTSSALAKNNLGGACALNSCNHRYKYGTLTVLPYVGGTLNITNTLRLNDEYLYGLGEMPSSWNSAALQAQAIAGRSYAYVKYQANPKSPFRSQCACQIYATTVDQNFVGFAKEYATAGKNWVDAVNATTTKNVVVNNGKVIETFFSSSTGGYTQPLIEAWGTSGYPWLTKVDDHWSQAATNPNSKWWVTVSQAKLVSQLHAAGVNVKDVAKFSVTNHYDSGAVSEFSCVDSAGRVTVISVIPNTLHPASPNISPSGIRSIFGLKSTYIRSVVASTATVPGAIGNTPDVLRILNIRKWPTTAGYPLIDFNLSGNLKPIQMGVIVTLSELRNNKWAKVATAQTDITGAWTLSWIQVPAGTHSLRIFAQNSVSSVSAFSPVITLAGSVSLTSATHYKRGGGNIRLTGVVTPATKDVTLVVQRKSDAHDWITIGQALTDSTGQFVFKTKVGKHKALWQYQVVATDPKLGSTVSAPVLITVR